MLSCFFLNKYSNRESGFGRYDTMLVPKDITVNDLE